MSNANFISELKRRNVIRMAGLYLVGAWLITQVAATVLPMFGAPDWVARSIVLLLVIGIVPALIFAWVFELTPEGLKRDTEVPIEQSIAPHTARRMDRLIIVGLLLALGYFGIDKFILAPARERASAQARTQALTPAHGASQNPSTANNEESNSNNESAVSAKSIAVLAFDNMSADKDNEYFSDGVAEEILNSLAKLKDLKVAGRTSSFSFKGKNEDLRSIGEKLGVAHVLEGSVRKQGARLRITAQLIRVNDGFHLWSETFDGTDADIFALQESIAQKVTGELKVALNAGQKNQLIEFGTDNPAAYELYLQASSIFNRRDRTKFLSAIDTLQRAAQLDPSYARAYARLASLYVVLPSYTNADPHQSHEQVMHFAEKALALDPNLGEPWAARGASLRKFRDQQMHGRDAFEEAMRINPSDPNARFWYGLTLLTTGYRRQGAAQIEQALALDPMLPNALRWRGMLYLQDGDLARAEPLLQRAYDLGLVNTANALSDLAMLRGDAKASTRLWAEGTMGLDFGMTREELMAVHQGIHGDAAAKRAGVEMVKAVLARMGDKRALPTLPLYLFRLDEPAQGLTVLRERQMGDTIDVMNWIWTRAGAPIRALPEFKDFLHDFHLPEVWDKYGAPDLCTKANGGNYVCQ